MRSRAEKDAQTLWIVRVVLAVAAVLLTLAVFSGILVDRM